MGRGQYSRVSESLAKCLAADNARIVNDESVGCVPQRKIAWRGQRPIVDRFWSRVNRDGPIHPVLGTACWLWTGIVVARYGYITLGHPRTPGSKRWKTHRFSWELHRGPIPDHLRVCHQCDNPLCVRPEHLFLGTQKENVHDAIRKGRRNAYGIQKLNPDDVRVIREQAARGLRQADIASAFRIGRSTVSGIVNRKSWNHLSASVAPLRRLTADASDARVSEAPAHSPAGPDTEGTDVL